MAAFVHGKTFVIAGGSSGTGFAVASILLDAGANVALYTTNQDDGSAFLNSLNGDKRTNALVRGLETTNRQSIKLFLQEAKFKFGKVHGCANITNTAGRRPGQEEIWEVDQDQYELFMDTNVRSCFNLLTEITKPGYLEEPSSIVHVSSICGEEGFLMGSVYSASEHAAIGLVKSAALEVGTRGIRVNIVTTGSIKEPRAPGSEITAANISRKSTEVANVVVHFLSPGSGNVTGTTWAVDSGNMYSGSIRWKGT